MAWIKFEKDLLTDPRILRMARRLCERGLRNPFIDRDAGVTHNNVTDDDVTFCVTLLAGGLVKLWCYADTHIDENNALQMGAEDINRVIGIDGFCDIAPADWLVIEDSDSSVKLPNYQTHNGVESRRRDQTAIRMQRYRERQRLRSSDAAVSPDLDLDLDKTKTLKPDSKAKAAPKPKSRARTKAFPPDDWKPSTETATAMTREFNLPAGGIDRYTIAFLDKCKANGYTYSDFDAAFRNCVREDWPKLRVNGAMRPQAKSLLQLFDDDNLTSTPPAALDDGHEKA